MKPRNIFLVRHGESEGNVNKELYRTIPDWKVPLTRKGHEQAKAAAEKLHSRLYSKVVAKEPLVFMRDGVMIYCSPWYRARETAAYFHERFKKTVVNVKYFEDPRLREQEWGNYQEESWERKIEKERKDYGTFFYRMPCGESGADVYDRVTTFLDTLHRDFEKNDFPENVLIVSHGLTIKTFLMRWFHWSVEEFQSVRNPQNCQIIEMNLNDDKKYDLITKLRERCEVSKNSSK